jgi:hypothetical protein
MHSKRVFGAASLGTAMGLVSLGFLIANSIGPIAAAWAAEVTGSRAMPVAVSAAVVLSAAFVVKRSD